MSVGSRVYLDVNIIMDFVTRRDPFFVEAEQLIQLAYRKQLTALTDTHTFPFCYFHLRKRRTAAECRGVLRQLSSIVEAIPLSSAGLEAALERTYPVDLEDAAQLCIAVEAGATTFITRNLKDFSKVKEIAVRSPSDFLRGLTLDT